MKRSITYSKLGVDYQKLDPVKILSQVAAKKTSKNFHKFNMHEVSESRGQTAFVWEEKDYYHAFVLECLGSKNLVADDVRKLTSKTYYDVIAQDTVACAVNDIVAVGAQPLVVNAYFSLGNSKWLEDEARYKDLVSGWVRACNISRAVWGGGETPAIKGITYPDKINLAASCVGIIKPKDRLTLGNNLQAGDTILLLESNGIHANGLTLIRAIAKKLPKGYATRLSDGIIFGEAILKPSHIYARLIDDLFKNKIDIRYMVNITGHGWKKLMRANHQFSYVVEQLPAPQLIFDFIKIHSGNSDKQMYGTFNMGAGFAIFIPEKDVTKAKDIAKQHHLESWVAGLVEKGPRQVIIKPKNIIFKELALH